MFFYCFYSKGGRTHEKCHSKWHSDLIENIVCYEFISMKIDKLITAEN